MNLKGAEEEQKSRGFTGMGLCTHGRKNQGPPDVNEELMCSLVTEDRSKNTRLGPKETLVILIPTVSLFW
jgi:hypothetical protein